MYIESSFSLWDEEYIPQEDEGGLEKPLSEEHAPQVSYKEKKFPLQWFKKDLWKNPNVNLKKAGIVSINRHNPFLIS